MKLGRALYPRIAFILGVTTLIVALQWQAVQPAPAVGEAEPPSGTEIPQEMAILDGEPFPTTPPDASEITVGPPDGAGYAAVAGAAGAVASEATVIVINLNARTAISTTAGTDGAFSATLYAPPGSSLLVKYELDGDRITRYWEAAQFSPPYIPASLHQDKNCTSCPHPAASLRRQPTHADNRSGSSSYPQCDHASHARRAHPRQ